MKKLPEIAKLTLEAAQHAHKTIDLPTNLKFWYVSFVQKLDGMVWLLFLYSADWELLIMSLLCTALTGNF